MEFIIFGTVTMVLLCGVFARSFLRRLYMGYKIRGPSLWKLLTVHAKHLLGDNMVMYNRKLCEYYKYKPWGLWIYGKYLVFVSDSASVSEVSRNKAMYNVPNVLFYEAIKSYTGDGLISVNGPKHKLHRKTIAPAFRKNAMEANMLSHTNEQGETLVRKLMKKVDLGDFCPLSLVQNEIMKSAFWALTSGFYEYPDLRKAVEVATTTGHLIQLRTVNKLYHWFSSRFTKTGREIEVAVNEFFDDMNEIVGEVTEMYPLKDENELCSVGDFIRLARADNKPGLQKEDLTAVAKTMIIAAYETTTTAIYMSLLMLALHPEVQEKIFQEMNSIFQDSDRPVEPDDLAKMVYFEAFMKEMLRMFPAIPMVGRAVDEDVNLNGTVVPKGSTLMINILALHRNPEYFKDPLKFDPDRFLPENSEQIRPMTYIPYGLHPRRCPGYELASFTQKILVSYVVRKFRILPGKGFNEFNDLKLKMCVSLKLCEYVLIRVVPRCA